MTIEEVLAFLTQYTGYIWLCEVDALRPATPFNFGFRTGWISKDTGRIYVAHNDPLTGTFKWTQVGASSLADLSDVSTVIYNDIHFLGGDGAGGWATRLLTPPDIPNLAASKITSGVFDVARIPDLAASIITSGTFNALRLPVFIVDSGSGGVRGAVPAPAVGDSDGTKFLNGDGTFKEIPAKTSAIIADVKTQGTQGGGSTANAWTPRAINTEVTPGGASGLVSISSNQFTPVEGNFDIDLASQFAFDAAALVSGRIRLYNVTQSAVVDTSHNYQILSTASVQGIELRLETFIEANGSDAYQVEYYVTDARATNGLGVAMNVSGESEIYTRVRLSKK